MRDALPSAAAHDPLASERAILTGDRRALLFLLPAIVVKYHPVPGLTQPVRSSRVREQHCIMALAARWPDAHGTDA
jgi:hypothetical protein